MDDESSASAEVAHAEPEHMRARTVEPRGDAPIIVVTRTIPDSALRILEQVGTVKVNEMSDTLRSFDVGPAIEEASALVTTITDKVDTTVIRSNKGRMRIVANIGVGYDNIDVGALHARGIITTNTPGVLTDATADLTLGLLLALTRRLGEGERMIRSQTAWTFDFDLLTGIGLQGRTLGVVGMGGIGKAVAHRARAFGMRIVYTGPRSVPDSVEREYGATFLALDELLRVADVVSLHCPYTPRTHHLINHDTLAAMRPDAVLINTSRGRVVNERHLVSALERRTIAGAALDVFEHEPDVPAELIEFDNVVLTPHLGSATRETRERMALLAAENVAAVLRGNGPLTPVRSA